MLSSPNEVRAYRSKLSDPLRMTNIHIPWRADARLNYCTGVVTGVVGVTPGEPGPTR